MTSVEPFALAGDDEIGAVLVHGFTGSPYEVRYLGDSLARAGITVSAPLLPGHGTSVDDLDRRRWHEWVDHVEAAVDALAARCGRVALIGQSLGGLIALHLASRRRDVAAVCSLAAPLWLDGLAGRVAGWAAAGRLPLRTLPKLGGPDVRDRRSRADNPCYRAIPARALGELVAFMGVAAGALAAVDQPVLVLHGRRDHTAPVACAPRIAELARARRLRILPRSYHLIAIDVERDVVAAEVTAFLRAHAAARPAPGELPCAM